ncbi:hypothetical protein ACS0TY_031902 [Phlomoides rotata]
MEEQQQLRKENMKRKRKFAKKKMGRNTLHLKTVFPLLLASLCSKSHFRRAVILKCLNKTFLSLPHINLPPILALLPSFLKFNCGEIVRKSAEIVGGASLASYEMNGQVSREDATVKGLISLLRSSKREIAMAACNAVLDLSTTSIGRERLVEFNAIENFLLCFIQESKPPAATVGLAARNIWLEEDEYCALLLQGATTLINSCTIEQLQCIPTDLSENFLLLLKGLWGQAYKQSLYCGSSICDHMGNEVCASSTRTNNLIESIFRLSVNYDLHLDSTDFEHVKTYLFDLGEAKFKQFFSDVWETSPILMRHASKSSLRQNSIFNPFLQYLGSEKAIPSILPSILECITSCPAIASDELDILHVIEDIKENLGSPIFYDQDIRVVRTESGERELHYFLEQLDSSFSVGPCILSLNDLLKCKEAFMEGYSIALRGMEFRYQTIAVIADGLASLFGQPSAGVNMYLTPSNSQGLACHSDDHCVFVCQLIGAKRWTVYSRPDFQLPRLYESSYSTNDMEDKNCEANGHQQILLKEGDVLYIPRGIPHEAIAVVDGEEDANNATGFSLHLTLAIEIEPPFEWEGFMHVALYSWDKKQKPLQFKSEDSVQSNLHIVSSLLLHIAIKLIGNLDPAFRKACLVCATTSPSDTRDWLLKTQKTTFGYMISKITTESKFSYAVSHLEAALQKNEDPLEHIRWMKYLSVDEEGTEQLERRSISSANTRYLFDLLIQHRDIAETAFTQVKSSFCDEVEFQDVEKNYKVLLEKYRKVRKQYTNGMLSLHSAISNA